MFQNDYILRLIEQMGVLIRSMIASLREQRPDEALELTDEALELSLGMGPEVFGSLTGEGLVMVMGAGGEPDAQRALLVGETLAHRAEALRALGELERADWERERARAVLETVVDSDMPALVEAAGELLGRLEESG